MPSKFRVLLEQVLELEAPAREGWIRERCQSDAVMADLLREGVRIDARRDTLLDCGLDSLVSNLGLVPPDESARLGTLIGPYRLTEVVGRGGMGIVYRAERTGSDFSQVVALKVVRDERISNQAQMRFVRERSVLARLQHENIAHLIDGGVDELKQPWFAMEFVEGEPLLQWCDRRSLDVAERLRLILDICAAIDYAHGRLVVHRDIKPSNVMVSRAGVVKILDFGIAKLLEHEAETRLATDAQTRLLTPEYAAPEQVLGEPITTATDVHALGLLIHEALCGFRAFGREASPFEIQRDVVEREPEAMALRLKRAETVEADSIRRAAALRGTDTHRLLRILKGDIQKIVSKALQKEPERRYANVSALTSDVQRYLKGQTVVAAGFGRLYRARRFIARNALQLALGGGAALALLCGTVAVAWQNQRIRQEISTAAAARDFLVDVFNSASPYQGSGRPPTAVDLVDVAVQRAQIELHDQPKLQAFLLNALGTSYATLGHRHDAVRILREAHAAAVSVGGRDSAQAQEIALSLVQAMLGEQPLEPAAAELADGLVAAQRLLPARERKLIVRALVVRALIRFVQGEHAASLATMGGALDEADARGPDDDAEHESSLEALAFVLSETRRDLSAIGVYRDLLDSRGRRQGSSVLIASVQSALALPLMRAGHASEAEALLVAARDVYRTTLGERAADYGEIGIRYGRVLVETHRLAEARAVIADSLSIASTLRGEHSLPFASALCAMAQLERASGNFKTAEALAKQAMMIAQDVEGNDGAYTSAAEHTLGAIYFQEGALNDAKRIFAGEAALGDREGSVFRVQAMDYLGRLQRLANDPLGAAKLHRRAIGIGVAQAGDWSLDGLRARMGLAEDERDVGHADEARAIGVENLARLRVVFAEGHPWVIEARLFLAQIAPVANASVRVEDAADCPIPCPEFRSDEAVPATQRTP
ncbi:MAG: serine/threonine-protein kinase [Rudaea sp.]